MRCARELGFCPDDIGELMRVTFFSTRVTLVSKKTTWEAQWRTARRRDRSSGALVGTHNGHERRWELGGNSKKWQPNDRTPWGTSHVHRYQTHISRNSSLKTCPATINTLGLNLGNDRFVRGGVHYFLTRSCFIITSIASIFIFRY